MVRALDVIVQGMVLEKKLEGTRQEEKIEAMMESDKFEGIVSCMPQDHKVVRTFFNARANAWEQLEEERRASSKAPSMVFSSQNLPEMPSDGKDHEPKVRLLQYKVASGQSAKQAGVSFCGPSGELTQKYFLGQ